MVVPAVVDGELEAFVLDRSGIFIFCIGGTGLAGDRYVDDEVVGLSDEVVGFDCQPVIQKAHLYTRVGLFRIFPGQGRISDIDSRDPGVERSSEYRLCAALSADGTDLFVGDIRIGQVGIRQAAPAIPQFQVAECRSEALHKIFFADPPTNADRGRNDVPVIGRVLRGIVRADIGVQQVAVFVCIIDPAIIGKNGIGDRTVDDAEGGRVAEAEVLCVGIGRYVFGGEVGDVVVRFSCFGPCGDRQVMLAELLVIGKIVTPVPGGQVELPSYRESCSCSAG